MTASRRVPSRQAMPCGLPACAPCSIAATTASHPAHTPGCPTAASISCSPSNPVLPVTPSFASDAASSKVDPSSLSSPAFHRSFTFCGAALPHNTAFDIASGRPSITASTGLCSIAIMFSPRRAARGAQPSRIATAVSPVPAIGMSWSCAETNKVNFSSECPPLTSSHSSTAMRPCSAGNDVNSARRSAACRQASRHASSCASCSGPSGMCSRTSRRTSWGNASIVGLIMATNSSKQAR